MVRPNARVTALLWTRLRYPGDNGSGSCATPTIHAGLIAEPFAGGLRLSTKEAVVVRVELASVEQRYRAVLKVLDGAKVADVARRYGVVRQTVHTWLRKHASGGLDALADHTPIPPTCRHQMTRVVEMRRLHRGGDRGRAATSSLRTRPSPRRGAPRYIGPWSGTSSSTRSANAGSARTTSARSWPGA